jgi:RNA binding exosome subunit
MIVLRERNENYFGAYIKNYYSDRDFILATISKNIDEKTREKILEKLEKKVEKKVEFFGIFDTEKDANNI